MPAGQVDRVTSAGRSGEVFEPRHTTHGFRFVRVEGHPAELTADDLTGVVVHTDLTRTGWFECSDERINRLHDAAVWSFRGNACDIPTDCPTRERAGWTGDWQIFVETAAFLYDVAGFSTKWLRDLAAEQWSNGVVANLAPSPPAESEGGFVAELNGSAGWGDAAVIVPWEIYRAYGDRRLLEQQWPSMAAWLSHVQQSAARRRHPARVQRHPQARPHERYLWDSGFHFGERLEPGEEISDFEAFKRADKAEIATAFFAHSAGLMSRIATVLGRTGDAERYGELANRARAAWRAEFVGADGALSPDTQANLELPGGIRGLMMVNDDGVRVELFERPGSGEGIRANHPLEALATWGYGHFALTAADIGPPIEAALEAGARAIVQPSPSPEPGVRFAFLADPEGNLIELVERSA